MPDPRSRRSSGRPLAPGSTKIPTHDSRIYRFLSDRLPQFRVDGRFCVAMFASAMSMSPKSVYWWFTKDKIAPETINKIVAASGGKLKFEDMVQFLLPATR